MNNHTQTKLHTVYGARLPDDIYKYYCETNPLRINLESNSDSDSNNLNLYWECVSRFLSNLHDVLLDPKHELSINNIMTENYYFLAKVCVDRSFAIGDLIKIRNDRKVKHNKNLANLLSHHVLPFYITNLYSRFNPSDHRTPTFEQTPVHTRINPVTGLPLQHYNYQAYSAPNQQFQFPFQFQPFQSFQPMQQFQPMQMQSVNQGTKMSLKSVKPKPPMRPRSKKPHLVSHSSNKKEETEELNPILIPTDTDLPSTVYDCYRPAFNKTASPLLPVDDASGQPSTIPT